MIPRRIGEPSKDWGGGGRTTVQCEGPAGEESQCLYVIEVIRV